MMISGKLTIWGACLALLAIAVGLPMSSDSNAHAQEPIDLTGDWNISLTFDVLEPFSCVAGIQQTGVDLFAAVLCPGDTSAIIRGSILRGSIDPTTNHVAMEGMLGGLPTILRGVASEDGTSVDGDWSTNTPLHGVFTAIRKDRSPSFIDLTGTWNLVIEPLKMEPIGSAFSDNCTVTIQQSLDELAATIDCDGLGIATLTGNINPLTRDLNLRSPAESPVGGFLGTAAPGGGFILGV